MLVKAEQTDGQQQQQQQQQHHQQHYQQHQHKKRKQPSKWTKLVLSQACAWLSPDNVRKDKEELRKS